MFDSLRSQFLPITLLTTAITAFHSTNLVAREKDHCHNPCHGEKYVPLTADTTPQGSWQPLTNQPNFQAFCQAQLTDGSILVRGVSFDFSQVQLNYLLRPDDFGSYVNGTWEQIASLPGDYAPLYNASAVLPDGRFLLMGGEIDLFTFEYVLTGGGAIYDPVANVWTPVQAPPFFGCIGVNNIFGEPCEGVPFTSTTGDASSVILDDGTFMLMDASSYQTALFDAKNLTWRETGIDADGNQTKLDPTNEEGWTLLPNGKVLAVDVNNWTFLPGYFPDGFANFPSSFTVSELYDPKTGTWSTISGSTVVPTDDSNPANPLSPAYGLTFEMGPSVLRPDGTVIQFGGTQYNSIYDYRRNEWTPTSNYPIIDGVQQTCQDAPACLLPNGNTLVITGSPGYNPPANVFEFTLGDDQFVQQPDFPDAPTDSAFICFLMVLPTGEVMLTDTSNDIEIYTPGNTGYNPDWAPLINVCPSTIAASNTYKISGIRFNGMSQCSGYGDDYQAATNFPLVRITNLATEHVFYCRTHDHSFMGVASKKEVCTYFDVPATIESGASKLEVVANGIPSEPRLITVS